MAIPVIIHLLLRQRRKPVMWGAMRFLIEAYRRQRQRLRVEQWLLLAARCLLVALIAAALARPLLQGAGLLAGPTGRAVYILLDTGLASSAREGAAADTTALARHKKIAFDLLASLGPSDRAGLVLLGSPASAVVAPASADIAAVRRIIDDAQPTDAATDLSGALERIADALDKDEEARARPTTLVVLSDFYVGSADAARPLPLSLAENSNVRLLVARPRDAGAAPTNIQVTAVEPLRPLILTGASNEAGAAGAEREQVRLTLRRSGPGVADSAASTIRLRATNGNTTGSAEAPPAQAVVRWQPGQVEATVAVQVNAAAGAADSAFGTVLVAEIDRDPLPADNTFRRPVGVRESLRVGIVARARFGAESSLDRLAPADWLRLALRPTPGTPIDVIDIEPTSIDTPTLASVDAVFAPAPDLIRNEDWSKLRRFVDAGGLLIISPAADATVHLWTDAMTRELGLSWRLAREPKQYEDPIALDEQAVNSPLLALIAAELPSLVRPVLVMRTVPPDDLGPQTEVLLKLKDGSPWLIASEPGEEKSDSTTQSQPATSRGLVVYFASAPALKWTDLPAKPLMVPLIQEIARQGFGRAAGTWASEAGAPVSAPARSTSLRPVALPGAESASETIAVTPAGISAEPIRRAGLWQSADEAGRPRGFIAVNPDPDAGRTTPQDPSSIRAWLAASLGSATDASAADERITWLDQSNATPMLAASQIESPFSVPLLIAVLILAVAELIMARYFSHAFAR